MGRRFRRLDQRACRRLSEPRYAISFLSSHSILIQTARTDSSVSGSRFYASGSPSLAYFLRDAAEAIAHPTKPGLTLWDARNDQGPLYGKTGEHFDAEARAAYEDELAQLATDDIGVGVLGSGSDYTVFLQRIGVRKKFSASLD